ncbi:MAG: ECF-type sigma factor, partial [Anaerolineales bacterium]
MGLLPAQEKVRQALPDGDLSRRVPVRIPDRPGTTLNEALERLEAADSRSAELVKLRFFAGLDRQQAAEALGVSVA